MLLRVTKFVSVLAMVAAFAAPLSAQVPTPAQAQQMLKTDPSMVGRLQQMMQSSGMTPEQIRDRLKAQGYPESFLDQYFPGGRGDSTAVPSDSVFAAFRSLGLADSAVVDSLSQAARARRRTRTQIDSAFLDTLARALRNDTTAAALRSLLRSREAQRQSVDSGFTVFGQDLFNNETNLFEANATGGADPSYRFGPGDRLTLILTGEAQQSYQLTVTKEGFVVIPEIGRVNVAGLTRAQLEDQLYGILGRAYSGVRRGPGATTHFYINVAQVGVNQIFVNGDVKHPASYRISRAGTVMTALYAAGGPTTNGSMRNVQVRRNGETIATLDVYDYALHGDASHDTRLENGDIVFVPPRGPQVRIAGAVLRPATYELGPTETVADAVRLAGGFTEAADSRRVQIDRIVPPAERTTRGADRKVIDVPSELFASAHLAGGDVIKVQEIARRVSNRVFVQGNVWTPGAVGFTPGLTLFDAMRQVGGLKPDSYLGDVLISRLRPDSSRAMLHTAMFDTTGRPRNNVALSDGDEITVFSASEFRPRRYISVSGSVRNPGRIPYSDGMTLHDAVLLAGGMTEGALLTEAEVSSLPENRAAGVTAVARTVPLDSTYLLERNPDGSLRPPPGTQIPAGRAPEVPLKPYDAVLIKRAADWQLQQTVSVQGEVQHPGDYTLVRKTETLSDIIGRAGGLTDAAYADGIVFIRRRGSVGRIGVDLPRVLRDPKFVDNLQLVDGDSLFIPRYAAVVTVRGSVNSPVGVAYVDGADLDFYIRSAGGPSIKGDVGRAYVTQPNGKVDTRYRRLGFASTPRPQPGSTVFVPDKDPNDKHDWAQIVTAATSVLGSLVAIAAIVRR